MINNISLNIQHHDQYHQYMYTNVLIGYTIWLVITYDAGLVNSLRPRDAYMRR